jgi:hypothetical protein
MIGLRVIGRSLLAACVPLAMSAINVPFWPRPWNVFSCGACLGMGLAIFVDGLIRSSR